MQTDTTVLIEARCRHQTVPVFHSAASTIAECRQCGAGLVIAALRAKGVQS